MQLNFGNSVLVPRSLATTVNFGQPGPVSAATAVLPVSSRQDLPLKRALPWPTASLQGRNKESSAYYLRSILLTHPDDRSASDFFLRIRRRFTEKVIKTRQKKR